MTVREDGVGEVEAIRFLQPSSGDTKTIGTFVKSVVQFLPRCVMSVALSGVVPAGSSITICDGGSKTQP